MKITIEFDDVKDEDGIKGLKKIIKVLEDD